MWFPLKWSLTVCSSPGSSEDAGDGWRLRDTPTHTALIGCKSDLGGTYDTLTKTVHTGCKSSPEAVYTHTGLLMQAQIKAPTPPEGSSSHTCYEPNWTQLDHLAYWNCAVKHVPQGKIICVPVYIR
ncbi:hypothetical protein AGOR_G00076290 [Albula goreensis]|uniref:Uncharacterized protein n=1 Tax=Albula goreensis TaxID=1534307 RepID=A0A8T3DRE7_9TELE|nr:hypothetical protein AGOR_G00076290 [Albula goreensis]